MLKQKSAIKTNRDLICLFKLPNIDISLIRMAIKKKFVVNVDICMEYPEGLRKNLMQHGEDWTIYPKFDQI